MLEFTYTIIMLKAQIKAMDPAGPYFELPDSVPTNQRHEVHLWRDDADFVDVIHTTAGDIWEGDIALGMKTAVGHADFFPNGGAKNQPGCHQVNNIFHLNFINS